MEHLYICAQLNDSGLLLAFTVKQNLLLEVAKHYESESASRFSSSYLRHKRKVGIPGVPRGDRENWE